MNNRQRPKASPEECAGWLARYEEARASDPYLSQSQFAVSHDVHKSTMSRWLARARKAARPDTRPARPATPPPPVAPPITGAPAVDLPEFSRWDRDGVPLVPQGERPEGGLDGLLWDADKEEPIDELLDRQVKTYERKKRSKANKVKRVRVPDGLPIAICHIGDPHVDAAGFNVREMQRVLSAVARTPGMYAGNLGDVTNNWVGRLQAEYAHQNTTLDDAVRLERWLLHSCPWAYLVIGNHDHWNQGGYLLREILRGVSVGAVGDHEVRLEFDFGHGQLVRIIARHQFRGRSQWNRSHGVMKALRFDPWADVGIQGHVHVHAMQTETTDDQRIKTALVVRGFKEMDAYADTLGLTEDPYGHSCTTILDPAGPPTERVRVVWDPDEAAEVLTWLRGRRSRG